MVIHSPDQKSIQEAKEHQDRLTKPTGALGELEDIACWLAGIQRRKNPQSRPAELILFATDHPISLYGVSAYPREVTGAMVHNILVGGAASSVLCKSMNLPLHLWDVGVDSDYPVPSLCEDTQYHRMDSAGSVGNLFEEDGMDKTCLQQCMEAGKQAIDRLNPDTKIVLFGEMGIGNTTPAAAVAGAILKVEAAEIVGAGTGVHGNARQNKISLVQKALDRCASLTDPTDILRCLGGREIAAMVAAFERSAQKGLAVWVDGFIVSSAALVACRRNPAIRPYLRFAHCSAEAGHQRILKALEANPLINCGLRLGEGTGALTAFPILEHAITLHNNMATFEAAAVPDRED
ncbi:MAG: nicotinate-nucleotide--dimethylbenzimidazole phosphoribosyltransferase [Myxococcota bacterium]|nr:nicotinate-nucleotide--dimethylbenzimidazole phosphoribosyltransferase [Myxococcota bacterium]